MNQISQSQIVIMLQHETKNLIGFLTMLTGDRNIADDLFQDTCLEILKIYKKYKPGTNFGKWAMSVARFQVLRYWRKKQKSKTVFYSHELMEQLTQTWEQEVIQVEDDPLESALKQCLSDLKTQQYNAIVWRYKQQWSLEKISTKMERTVDAVKMLFSRLRKKLRLCVETRIKESTACLLRIQNEGKNI